MGNQKSKKKKNGDNQDDLGKSLNETKKDQKRFEYLASLTNFDEVTIRLLNSRFKDVDSVNIKDGKITLTEFCRILDVPKDSLIAQRFYKIMDKFGTNELNFTNFVKTLSTLSERANIMDKIDLSFELYDMNKDGIIDHNELRHLLLDALKEMFPFQLTNNQITSVIDETFKALNTKKWGEITKDEYKRYCLQNPYILRSFTMDVSHLIRYKMDERRKQYTISQEEFRRLVNGGIHHGPAVSPRDKKAFFGSKKSTKIGFGRQKTEQVVSLRDISKWTAEEKDLEIDLDDLPGLQYSQSQPASHKLFNKYKKGKNKSIENEPMIKSKINSKPIPPTYIKRPSLNMSDTSQINFEGTKSPGISSDDTNNISLMDAPKMNPMMQISLSSDAIDSMSSGNDDDDDDSKQSKLTKPTKLMKGIKRRHGSNPVKSKNTVKRANSSKKLVLSADTPNKYKNKKSKYTNKKSKLKKPKHIIKAFT